MAAKNGVWPPGVRRDGRRGTHAERSVSVNAAARVFTWCRTDAGNLPAIRATWTLAVRAFHDQVPARMPSMITLAWLFRFARFPVSPRISTSPWPWRATLRPKTWFRLRGRGYQPVEVLEQTYGGFSREQDVVADLDKLIAELGR